MEVLMNQLKMNFEVPRSRFSYIYSFSRDVLLSYYTFPI